MTLFFLIISGQEAQQMVQWDVSPWWKYLETSMLDAVTYPNITVGTKWREARIFISSTFVDMHGERDILTRVVLPEIKERAKQRKIKIFEVDLRWVPFFPNFSYPLHLFLIFF